MVTAGEAGSVSGVCDGVGLRYMRNRFSLAAVLAAILAVHVWPVLMVCMVGAEFFGAVGVPWSPEHGYGPAIAVMVLQLAVSVLIFLPNLPREWLMLALLGVALLGLGCSLLFPSWVPPMTNGTNVWINIACSHIGWTLAYFGWRGRFGYLIIPMLVLLNVLAIRVWALDWSSLATGVLMATAPTLLGLFLGYRVRTVHALRERAERADRERQLLAEQARADERVKLAGEMHDVVTHRLSLMVLQAGALGVTAGDEQTRAAAEELRAAGCEALEELRDLIGVLRSPAEERDRVTEDGVRPPSLTDLVEGSRAVGLDVSLTENGSRAHVSPVVGRTAYRIVQEGLTNVHKHAPGARTEVTVDYERERLRLRVRNAAPSAVAHNPLPGTGSGSGLRGLRRRVELVHGRLDAVPDNEGGFLLEAVLPAYVPTEKAKELV